VRAVVYHGPRNIRVKEVPEPKPKKGEALVRFMAGSLCGTDLHFYRGDWKTAKGRIIGHDASGEVVETGLRVAIEPILYCGRCTLCLSGRYNLCPEGAYMGMSAQGCFADLMTIPGKNLHAIPENVSYEEAAILEPVALALHTFNLLTPRIGNWAVILGQGPIGLAMTQVARLSGCRVIAVDVNDFRLEVAERFGAEFTVNPKKEDLRKRVLSLTKHGADLVVEAAGQREIVEQAAGLVGPAGRVALVGAFSGFVRFGGEATFFNVEGGPGKYPLALELISRSLVDVRSLITHVFPLEEFQEAVETALNEPKKPLKVLLKPS